MTVSLQESEAQTDPACRSGDKTIDAGNLLGEAPVMNTAALAYLPVIVSGASGPYAHGGRGSPDMSIVRSVQ